MNNLGNFKFISLIFIFSLSGCFGSYSIFDKQVVVNYYSLYEVEDSFVVLQLPSPSDKFVTEIDRGRFYQTVLQILLSNEDKAINILPIPSSLQATGFEYSDNQGNSYSVVSGCDNIYPFPINKRQVRLRIIFQKPSTQGYKEIKINENFEVELKKNESLFISLNYSSEKLIFNKKKTPGNLLSNKCK